MHLHRYINEHLLREFTVNNEWRHILCHSENKVIMSSWTLSRLYSADKFHMRAFYDERDVSWVWQKESMKAETPRERPAVWRLLLTVPLLWRLLFISFVHLLYVTTWINNSLYFAVTDEVLLISMSSPFKRIKLLPRRAVKTWFKVMQTTFCRDTASFKAAALTNGGRFAHFILLHDSMPRLLMAVLNQDLSDHRFLQPSAENSQQDDVWEHSSSFHKEFNIWWTV